MSLCAFFVYGEFMFGIPHVSTAPRTGPHADSDPTAMEWPSEMEHPVQAYFRRRHP